MDINEARFADLMSEVPGQVLTSSRLIHVNCSAFGVPSGSDEVHMHENGMSNLKKVMS